MRVSVSIGDLREAYHKRDWFKFFALPTGIIALWNSGALWMLGFYVHDRDGVALALALLLSVPITSACLFAWWAAIYTKLE